MQLEPETSQQLWPHDLLRDIYNTPDMPRKIRSKIRHSLPPVELDYRGCRMRVHPSDNNTEFQIWRLGRTHEERAIRDILARLTLGPFLAYDIGANAGSFCVRFGQVAPEGSFIRAFEPNPTMRARLTHNLSLNRSDQVSVHDCAIANTAGEMDLWLPEVKNLGQARLNIPFENGECIRVPVRNLIEFAKMDAPRRIDFIKVDIEGYEDQAICPLLDGQSPDTHPRLLFFEHKHKDLWQEDLTERVLNCGYRMVKEYGRNALFELVV